MAALSTRSVEIPVDDEDKNTEHLLLNNGKLIQNHKSGQNFIL